MSSLECVGNLESSVAHMEGHVEEQNGSQKTMMNLFNKMVDEFITTIDAIRGEMTEMYT